jgi:hypothetical protein
MKKVLFIGIIGLYGIFCSMGADAFAASNEMDLAVDEAVILFLSGDVKVKDAGSNSWRAAKVGMVLSSGMSLRTGMFSWAEVGFSGSFNSIVKVKKSTTLELIDLGRARIGLLKGEIRSLIEDLGSRSTFEVETPSAVCGARGTGWDTNTDGRKVTVDAFEDEVYFSKLDGTDMQVIGAGKRGTLGGPRRSIKVRTLPSGRMRDWGRWKGDVRGRVDTERGTIIEKMRMAKRGMGRMIAHPEHMMDRHPGDGMEHPEMDMEHPEMDMEHPEMDMEHFDDADRPDRMGRIEEMDNVRGKVDKMDRLRRPHRDIRDLIKDSREDLTGGDSGDSYIDDRVDSDIGTGN